MRGGAWSRYRHDARIRAYDLACWTNATDRGPQSPDGSASRSGSQERDKARETAAVNEDVMEEILGQRDTAVNELGVDRHPRIAEPQGGRPCSPSAWPGCR